MANLHTVEEWEGLHPLHYIFALGFLTLFNIEPDELHVIYLGIGQYFLGSIIALLVFVILPDGHVKNMDRIWEHILEVYSILQVPTQFGALNIASLFPGGENKWGDVYPKLGGKGAEIKWLIIAMSVVWKRLVGDDGTSDPPSLNNRCLRALETLATIIDIIDAETEANFLKPASIAEIIRLADLFLHDFSRLSKSADENGFRVFTCPPKLHYFWHWARRCAFLHPRRGSCFSDEEFVGIIKTIAHSCVMGAPLNLASVKTILKYYAWRDFDLRHPS
jgi:hypothetical protein